MYWLGILVKFFILKIHNAWQQKIPNDSNFLQEQEILLLRWSNRTMHILSLFYSLTSKTPIVSWQSTWSQTIARLLRNWFSNKLNILQVKSWAAWPKMPLFLTAFCGAPCLHKKSSSNSEESIPVNTFSYSITNLVRLIDLFAIPFKTWFVLSLLEEDLNSAVKKSLVNAMHYLCRILYIILSQWWFSISNFCVIWSHVCWNSNFESQYFWHLLNKYMNSELEFKSLKQEGVFFFFFFFFFNMPQT